MAQCANSEDDLGGIVGPTQRGSNLRMGQGIQAHRPPIHISKTVLSTVHVGPPGETRTLGSPEPFEW